MDNRIELRLILEVACPAECTIINVFCGAVGARKDKWLTLVDMIYLYAGGGGSDLYLAGL